MPVTAKFASTQISRLPFIGTLTPEQRRDLADALIQTCGNDAEAKRVIDEWTSTQSSCPSRAELLTLARSMKPNGEWRPANSNCTLCRGTRWEPYLVVTEQKTYDSGACYVDKQEISISDMQRMTNEPDGYTAYMAFWRDLRLNHGQGAYQFSRRCQCVR